MRVAVIGARRARQGTGAFVAREFKAAGAQVVAVLGTQPDTAAQARRDLAADFDIDAEAFTDLDALLRRVEPDALAVCSPKEAHEAALELGLRAGCHVLCEKPLHFDPQERPDQAAARAARWGERFRAAQRVLHLNAQWPYTLPTFDRLHPTARQGPLRSLHLRLSPMLAGAEMVADSASHLASLLWALAGDGDFTTLDCHGDPAQGLRLRGRYADRVDVDFELVRCLRPPRPAGYSVNGRAVQREIELPEYRLRFRDGEHVVALEDPLGLSVRDFMMRTTRGLLTDPAELAHGARLLQALYRAALTLEDL